MAAEGFFAGTPFLVCPRTDRHDLQWARRLDVRNYQRLNDPANGGVYSNPRSDKYPIQDVNGPYWVPASVTVTGSGTTLTSKYYYAELKKDLLGRGILGFASIAITDPNGKVRSISYRTDFPYIGAVSSDVLTATVNGNPVTIRNIQNTWSETTYGGLNGTNYYFPYLAKKVATGGDLDGSLLPEVDTTYTPDSYGNTHVQAIYIPDDGFTSTTTNTYQQNADPWIVNEITGSTTYNILGSSKITRQNTFNPQAATGLILNAYTDSEDKNLELDFAFGYDQWGNANSLTESSPAANGGNFAARTTTANYGTTGEFLASITNALNYTSSFGFDSRFGSISGFMDPNNISQSWTADAFGRASTAVAPSGATVTVTYNYPNAQGRCGPSAVTPSGCAFYSGTTVIAGGAAITPPSYTYYDSLSRVIAVDKQSFDGTTWVRVTTTYDGLGHVSTVSEPYFVSSGQSAVTTYGGYDVLNRATTVSYPTDNPAHPTATTTYTYSAKQVTVTDDHNNSTITARNDEGLVSDVKDANGKDTQYSYDAFGDPVQVKTPAGNLVTNSFDAKGRKYQSTDPDMGIWTYQYDALNELTAQSSQVETHNGQTTTLGYDQLGRLVSRIEPDMAASWTYDTAQHGIGRIAAAQCTSGAACPAGGYKRSYVYDSFGRQISIDIQAGSPSGANYYTTETYDPNTTQLQTVRAFSGFSYSYLYNAQGYMCEIVNYTNAGGTCGDPSMTVFWQADAADAFGHITEETAGNGIVTTRNYSGVTGNLLAISAGPSSNVENASYTWDSVGDLLTRVDNIQDYSDNFCYDPLYRLTNYSVGASNNTSCTEGSNLKSMQYDAGGDGNIVAKTDIGTYSYAGAGPHAVSSIATAAGKYVAGIANANFFYDADGNMECITQRTLCDANAARTYTWTSFDMVEQVAQGTNAASFTYSPEHERIIQTTSTGTLLSVNDPVGGVMAERSAGSTITWRTYLLAYGRIVAERFTQGSNVSMLYFSGDHLGSTVALTNGNAPPGIQEQDSYDAWGERRNDNGTDKNGCTLTSATLRGYTGEEMMDSFCLVNLNGRIYDPTIGRFLSADPTVPYPMNGQSFNRYSYVANDPLALFDPSGYTDICFDEPSECGKIVQWGGDSCLNCGDPWYRGADAMMFLAFGGLGGMGVEGFGAGGAAIGIGDIGNENLTQDASLQSDMEIPPETVVVWGCCSDLLSNADFSWDQPWANAGFLEWDGTYGNGSDDPAWTFQGRGTLQIGYSVTGVFSIPGLPIKLGWLGSAGLAVDTQGDVGIYATGGAGPTTVGMSEDSGVTVQLSNALTINDLIGPFDNFSVNGGTAVGGSLDGFYGPSPNGPVLGTGFTFGEGVGISGAEMITTTFMWPVN